MRPVRTATVLRVAAAALLLGSSASLAAAPMPSRTYVHPDHKFLIKIISDWSQTPTQPHERVEVAKFKAESHGSGFATLSVYRFGADAAETLPTEIRKPDNVSDEQWERFRERLGSTGSALSKLTDTVHGMQQRFGVERSELPKPRKVKAGKVKADLYEIEIEPEEARWGVYAVHYTAAILEKGGVEYLLLFYAPATQSRKYRNSFKRSVESFRFPDEIKDSLKESNGDDDEEDFPTDAEYLGQEKRDRIKKELIDSWSFIDTPHYIVIYDCDKGLAKAIAKRIERMRTQCYEEVFPARKPITEVMVVRVCQDRATFSHYGAPPGAGGYWSSYHDELVFPDFSRSKKPDEATLGVLHHEGFHQYIHYALEGRPFPISFNEGFAEYFFCAEPKGRKKMEIGNRHPMRHGTVKTLAATGKLTPLKRFVYLTQAEHYRESGKHYAEGWAFVYWLMKGTRNKDYQAIPPKLYNALFDMQWKDAIAHAFEGIDLEEMHEEFLRDLKRIM